MAKYFKNEEVKGLDSNLIRKLDDLRSCCGIPVIITSGLRNIEKNKEVGGVENSSHLKGLAVDIRTKDSLERYAILGGAIMAVFKRIGLGKGHLHLDIDEEKPQRVFFLEY